MRKKNRIDTYRRWAIEINLFNKNEIPAYLNITMKWKLNIYYKMKGIMYKIEDNQFEK